MNSFTPGHPDQLHTRSFVDLSARPQWVFSTTRSAGVRGKSRHVSAVGERYTGEEIERGSVLSDRSEREAGMEGRARIEKVGDRVPKLHSQFMKKAPKATKPSSWQSYSRCAQPSGAFGFHRWTNWR